MSVAYRFLLGSLLLFAWCALRKLPLRFTLREHAWLALFGVGSFGIGYVCVYYAELYVVSGLVAVGYSASPLLGMLGMRLAFGTPMTRRVALASALGIGGIVIVFYPELALSKAAPIPPGAPSSP
jgi:drug/metabolite transporter (DMT)-like permease